VTIIGNDIEGGGMSGSVAPSRFHDVGWRVLAYTISTHVRTGSLAEGAALVDAICDLAAAAGRPVDVDLRPTGVTVRLRRHESGALTQAELTLADGISGSARALGLPVDLTGLQGYQIAIDALVIADVMPFWAAVLGYEEFTDSLVDPDFEGPTVWFQQMDAPRPQRNRIHLDLYLPEDQAKIRIDAAVAAGGRIVNEANAPGWWTLADPEGNEVDVAPWPDTD
jgi:4a-hydroxytetrahydrobiopterin dehydratase